MRNSRTSPVRTELVKAALSDLRNVQALRRSPLCSLPGRSPGPPPAVELHALLADVVVEIAASPRPRDAESGRLLLDYYVKRVGSHEVVMERLCLSRPTFYRRLHRGLSLVTERLEELDDPAVRDLAEVSMPDSHFETTLRLPVRATLAKAAHVDQAGYPANGSV